MTSDEIRKKYINYFKQHNHKVIRSSSLVPNNDPTLLFTNAGMVQFKRIFLGEEEHYYNRATSSQKCVRAGGKHNDLENVGYTTRHHTFFEMLGNFSFGDYFKQKAIEYAWDLITNIFKLPSNKLWISIYSSDDESYKLWRHSIGIPENRIVRLGRKENFWSMGETGPCGPCSEIHIDRGKNLGCGAPTCGVSCNCDRFIELWNLVFMQFNRDKSGNMTPLPQPSIDTGLGLERLASIIQNVETNFETDLMFPIINRTETLAEIKYGSNKKCDIAMKVIADHTRSAAFLIGDGIIPSNEGRGYVLRRIIRRAIRYGHNLNLKNPFLYDTVEVVFNIMEQAYPELKSSAEYITNIIKNEEMKFSETIGNGLKILNENLEEIIRKGNKKIPGNLLFKLHDTYGFPVDIVRDVARDKGMFLDLADFQANMDKQRQQSNFKKKLTNTPIAHKILSSKKIESKFVGYDSITTYAKVIFLSKDGREVKTATKGSNIELVTNLTPFYVESGGQIGDHGLIEAENLKLSVTNTVKTPSGIIVHNGEILSGNISVNQIVSISVNENKRIKISRNHTATHILHSILREELGKHVKQSGSLVTSEKLRFDFAHFSKISRTTLDKIESKVNEKITNNTLVKISKMPIEKAIESGATALFEEKYEDQVRVVSIESLSKELCGGTHVSQTGNIGMFTIVSEYGIASGIRRIEAITSHSALKYLQKLRNTVEKISLELKTPQNNVLEKIIDMKTTNKVLEKKATELTTTNAILKIKSSTSGLFNNSDDSSKNTYINGIKIKTGKVEVNTTAGLREMADQLKNEIKSGIIALGSEESGKAKIIVSVTKDLLNKFNANEMVKKMAKLIGGTGGGRPDMAQAGGNKPQYINQALEMIKSLVEDKE